MELAYGRKSVKNDFFFLLECGLCSWGWKED